MKRLVCALLCALWCRAIAMPAAFAAPPWATCSGGAACTIAPAKPPAPEKATAGSYALAFSGRAVNFDLSGMEPDFDPIYKIVVTGTLHDRRPAARALPDATLVLSAYLEAFQPDTTPILPDLLHPDQVANNLGGFLTGKAALVNRGGNTAYRGDLLSEIFADSTEHLIVDLYPAGAAPDAPAIRLQGIITLKKGGAEVGSLRALTPLAPAALDVPAGPQPSWQSVIGGLSVKVPAMLGTGGTPGQTGPGATVAPVGNLKATAGSSDGIKPYVLPLAGLGVLAIVAGIVLGWRDKRRGRAMPRDGAGAASDDAIAGDAQSIG